MKNWQKHYNAILREHVVMCSNIAGGANALRLIERYIDKATLTYDRQKVRDWIAKVRSGMEALLEQIANRN